MSVRKKKEEDSFFPGHWVSLLFKKVFFKCANQVPLFGFPMALYWHLQNAGVINFYPRFVHVFNPVAPGFLMLIVLIERIAKK